MKKKILLSVVASALLSTAAFAATPSGSGTLNLAEGGGASTVEYIEKYGHTDALDLGDLVYTADIKGSGSVSDALIRLDLTDTNLTDTANAGLDVANTGNTPAFILNEDNETVATYDKKITVGGRTYFLFDGNSNQSIVDGVKYRIAKDDNQSVVITYNFESPGTEVKLDVYSTSGSEEKRDETVGTVSTSESKQFKTNCVAKFDGLINFEDFRKSFVNTTHDNISGLEAKNDHYGLTDTLVFTVDNDRGAGNFLEGNSSVVTLYTVSDAAKSIVNVDNNFSDPAKWTVSVNKVDPDGTATPSTILPANAAFDAPLGLDYNGTTGRLDFSFADSTIEEGLTTFYVNFTNILPNTIAPVRFVNGSFAIEGGENDANNSIAPAKDTGTEGADLGLWQNHAYIAQIAGATQDAYTQTKLFIVNRSCAPVTPTFRIVKDGVVTEVEGDVIAADTQQKTLLSVLLTKAGLPDGRYAVEIILSGIAEDFYVYAQAQGKTDKTITKDLPVYTTSDRN